ncbi:MAG: deoxynucleoside kinase [Bacteroidetes bacterium HGW-Bacteroidetes-4]|jgi:deoxyadenosine/deoxycytidine kinase|nr:MAG: deoxynucleoside kinase [Bacteroidetes bacterium HGW-Bacteroidetes-4]
MDLANKYIVIEGNIGAGKSTLVNKIAEQYNGKIILEQFHDNPFLPKFYNNPDRYSFPLELSFLAARYKQLNTEISSTDLFKSFTIADYYFVKSLVFARSTLNEDEFNLYRQLFNIIYQQLPLPNLYVYLHTSPERLLEHIKLRGRDYEKTITAGYLLQIQKSYFEYFKTENRFPIVIIETTHIDFVSNPADYEKLKALILDNDYEKGMNRVVVS